MNRSRLRFFMLLYTVNYSRSHPVIPMMTSSNGNIFRVTGHLCGEFTGHLWIPSTQTPVTRSFDTFFDLRLNKRLSKHSWGWRFETPSRLLWRHCNNLAASAGGGRDSYYTLLHSVIAGEVCCGFAFRPQHIPRHFVDGKDDMTIFSKNTVSF